MSLGGIVSGLIGSGSSLPTVDIGALLSTINSSGDYQKQLINGLPPQIQQLLAQYAQSNAGAGAGYQKNVEDQGANYLTQVSGLYGPDSSAAQAAKVASKQDIYSTLPGTQDAIRNALAATGGLGRGNAATALAQPYMQAAQTYGKAAAGINTQQLQQGQQAQQQALQTINTMNDQMFQNLFGMTKQQAQTILTTGNDALRDQLTQLITQSNNQTNQTLSAQGIAVNNGYQNAVTRNAQQNAVWNGLAGLATQPADSYLNGVSQSIGQSASLSPQDFMQLLSGGGSGVAGASGGGGVAGAAPAFLAALA